MRTGKVSESILKRSIIKTIKYKRKEITAGAKPGNDATVLENQFILASANAGYQIANANFKFDCKRALMNAANNVAAKGGEPIGARIDLVLPESMFESDLREIMEYLVEEAKKLNIQIAGGNTEVSKHINKPMMNVTVFGKKIDLSQSDSISDSEIEETETDKSGQMDIVMTKYIAMSGTVALTKENYPYLLTKFQKSYLQKALDLEEHMSVIHEAAVAGNCGVQVMHDLSRGGIFSGLWELAEITKKGIEVELTKIPVLQETIELCEQFGLNPYNLMSDGALLFVCTNGEKLVSELEHHNIKACVIGKLTDSNDKVITKNEERRYIEPPKGDELDKLYQ